jgi:V/A-type H+-transporting ATPase subunit E
MEEIRGTEALEREILDDARKRADRIVRKAVDEAKELQAQTEQKIKAAIDALTQEYHAKQQTAEKEVRSRLPLEKMRLEIQYRDEMLRNAVAEALAKIDARLFGAWCLRGLKRQVELIRGSKATISVKGLHTAYIGEIKALFQDAGSVSIKESEAMKARGIIVEPYDNSYRISITENELVSLLLDEERGELASALFGDTP